MRDNAAAYANAPFERGSGAHGQIQPFRALGAAAGQPPGRDKGAAGFPPSARQGQTEPSDSKAEGFRAHAAECRELANRCWQEESKQRYEELARHWLKLAEQRQRSA